MRKNFGRICILLVAVVFAFTSCASVAVEEGAVTSADDKRIGIITAMGNELQMLLDNAEIERTDVIGGVEYHVGTLEGKNVVLVKAGIGKALSASGATVLIHEYGTDAIIFTGIAGGVADETEVLDMVISTDCVFHDYGAVDANGFVWEAIRNTDNGRIYANEDLINAAYEAAVSVVGEDHAFKGTVVTGDQFVASEFYVKDLQERFNAYATEMEGASVAYVASQFDVPFVVLRCMSDKADGLAHGTYENFGNKAADNSANIVMTMLRNF